MIPGSQEDILRLEIAVVDFFGVAVLQHIQDLGQPGAHAFLGERPALAVEQLHQVAALDVGHGDKTAPADDEEIIHRRQVGVTQLGEHAGFALELLQGLLAGGAGTGMQVGVIAAGFAACRREMIHLEFLQGHKAVLERILGAVDRAHAARADQPLHNVTAVQFLAWMKHPSLPQTGSAV